MKSDSEIEGKRPVDRLFKLLETFHEELEQVGEEYELQARESLSTAEGRAQAAAELNEKVGEAEEVARRKVTEELLNRFHVEIEELKAELGKGHAEELAKLKGEFDQAKTSWNAERQRLKAQVVQVPSGKETSGNEIADSDLVRVEISRVSSRIEELVIAIEDPTASLSRTMRANRDYAEVKSYLKGLRFSLGEIDV